MRIAVFADVHANPYACDAVLEGIQKEGPFDEIVAAGDLCLGGSDPVYCLDRIFDTATRVLYGNTEKYVLNPLETPPDRLHRQHWDQLQEVAYWVRERIGPQRIERLRALDFEARFSPTGDPRLDLLAVHANPRNVVQMILPSPEEQNELFGEVRQPDDDADLVEVLEGVSAAVVAFGHFHHTSLRAWRHLKLVDVGPCSLPSIDGDPRARFTILAWDGSDWTIERRWYPYQVEKELAALEASDMPHKAMFIDSFGVH